MTPNEAIFERNVRENTEKVLRAALRAVVRDPGLTMISADGEAAVPSAREPGGPARGARRSRARAFVRFLHIVYAFVVALRVYARERIRFRGKGREGRQRAAGRALVRVATDLGATFIKIGQIISTRADLLPRPLLEELARLQDRVPPFPFEDVRKTIESELGRPLEEIYERFDQESVAAGSVAQVHRAMLRSTGDVVAVKVRRPDIAELVRLDRAILLFLARMLERVVPSFRLASLEEAVGEFCRAVEGQLDFVREAHSIERCRDNFRDDPDQIIPRPYPEASSMAVLTMEWVEGLREEQLGTSDIDMRHVVRSAVRGVCRATFVHGFLHADPHPGNIRFLAPGRIVTVDYGLMAELSDADRLDTARLLFGIVTTDGKAVAKILFDQAPRRDPKNYAAYEADMCDFVAKLRPRGLGNIEVIVEIGRLFDILRRHRVQARSHLTMIYVALLSMEGLAKRLDPNLSVFDEMVPYLAEGLGMVPRTIGRAGAPPVPGAATEEAKSRPLSFAGGRYQVLRMLGEGAKKRVYLARDEELGREVAVAALKTEGLDELKLARLRLEARAMARLGTHPGIVGVHDIGEDDGKPYVVTEYMAGGTLAEVLERREGRKLPIADALPIAEQICEALEYAHERGIVHRDLKPANVWLSSEGFAKLGDFGLSTASDFLRESDAFVGTAQYMPPEQALGRPVGPRSDLYALGCMLYEMLTGAPPFSGVVAEVVAHHLQTQPAAPSTKNPDVPKALDSLVLRCLAKKPEERPETAAHVARELAEIVAATGAEALAPSPLERIESGIFVGREQEMDQLLVGLDEAARRRGKLFLLTGEPGIGKTRTCEELAVHARRRGLRVLFGRCHEGEGAPAFWPWVQILRSHVQEREPAALAAELGHVAAEVAQLVPEIRERVPHVAAIPVQETEEARFRLFDAITTFLKNAAKVRPLVLVLDDLHWSDKPSLLLLQFLAREIGDAKLFIVATYRDVDVVQGHPLAEVLPSLRRAHAQERIRLRGFEEAEVRAMLTALGGQEIPTAFVRAIHRETEGNPFFIEEMLSHLVEEGTIRQVGGRWVSDKRPEEMGLPEGVRDVIGRRISRLGESCRRALTIASAIGREFDVAVLERVIDLDRETVTAALAEAESARVIAEVPRALGRYRFTHALIRETLYGEIRTAQRVTLHRQIASTLEDLYRGEAIERHLAELAYHFAEAAVGGEVDKAVAYATRAGEHAATQLAFEEAMRCFYQALQALELRDPVDEAQRCELLLRLGEARFGAGDFEHAKETFLHVAELAERLGMPDALGRAALGYGGLGMYIFGITQPNDTLVVLLEKARAALPDADGALRARVTGRLASALVSPADTARRLSLAREAIAMARRTGDKPALAQVLNYASWAFGGPDEQAERTAAAQEVVALARELRDATLESVAAAQLMWLHYERGDYESQERSYAWAVAERSRQTYIRWAAIVAMGARAAYNGAFDEAERFAGEALRLGQDFGLRDALLVAATQLGYVRALQGRASEEIDRYTSLLRQYPGFAVNRYMMLFMYAEAGRREDLRRQLGELSLPDFSDIPRDFFFLPITVMLAESIWYANDERRASSLYDVLARYDGRNVAAGPLFLGSMSRYLGLLASVLRRYDAAVRHFEDALEMERKMRGAPFIARIQHQYAEMLNRRGRSGDRDKALALLSAAIEGAEKLGMRALLTEATKLRLEIQGVTEKPERGSIDLVASSIDMRRPDLASHAAPDGTVTLLFSDVEDFTGMTERLGDRRAHDVIRDHNSIVRSAVKAHDGFEVELMGDGFLIAFDSARRGLECAIAIQQRFSAYNATHPEVPLRVRMGLHTGEAIREANKFFGKTVIVAARIAAHARGGQILVSSLLRQLTQSSGLFRFGNVAEVALKGLAERQAVCAVGWEGHEPAAVHDVAAPVAAAEAAIDGNVFRRTGDFWTISFEDQAISLRDAKGLNYLSRLLAEPGRELHVLDLVGAGERTGAVGAGLDSVSADLGSAGEVLDAQAKAEYRSRLEDLKGELEEAEAANDAGRTSRLKEEIEFLSQELSAAFGLGGRSRKAGEAAERARKAVAGRINDTIGRIRKEHPPLALHLENAVRLGTFCEYHPEKATSWKL